MSAWGYPWEGEKSENELWKGKVQTEGQFKAEPGEYGIPGEQPAAACRKTEEISHLCVDKRFCETLYWKE